MKLKIFDTKKGAKGDLQLPAQFNEPVRQDLIHRVVLSLQAGSRQPYGTDPDAGMRYSAKLSRRRRNYRGSYGKGISRVPRKILNRRGSQMYMVGALAPGTVGGRRAHPPKASKVWDQKVNRKENRKAIRSALAAVIDKTLVTQRGHKLPAEYPFIIDDSFETLAKTKDVMQALLLLGFEAELARSSFTTVRAGKGKLRGRKSKRAVSLLLVTGDDDVALLDGAANIPGVTVVPVRSLNVEVLAPGTHAGRATLFTQHALKVMQDEQLFLDGEAPAEKTVKPAAKKEEKVEKTEKKPAVKAAAKPAAKPAKK